MRRLACLVLLGAMHPVMASAPEPSAQPVAAATVQAQGVREVSAPAAMGDTEAGKDVTAATAVTAGAVGSVAASGAPEAAGYVPKTPYDNSPYRFDMSQQGKRMSAADFDAWMKARGLRVAGAKPAEPATTEPAAPSPAPLACQPAPTQAC